MKRLFFLLLIFGGQVSANNLNSASVGDTINKALFGIYGMVNMPSTQFAEAGYRTGGGAGFEWYTKSKTLSKIHNLNSRVGLSMFYAGQGGVTNKVSLHDPADAPGTQTLHNNIFGMDFRTKIIHDKNTVRPYVDLFVGIRNYSTAQTLTIDQPVDGYINKMRTSELNNLVLDYGASFGFLIKLSNHAFFDIKANYCTGNSAVKFVDFGNMGYDGYMYNYNGHSAIPQMISFQAGLIFKFKIEINSSSYPVEYTAENIEHYNPCAKYHDDNYSRGGHSHSSSRGGSSRGSQSSFSQSSSYSSGGRIVGGGGSKR